MVLTGGGARGSTWQATVARLSGRTVHVPDAAEPVALGAAAQAAACLTGSRPSRSPDAGTPRRGRSVDPPARRDVEPLERIRATRAAAHGLLDPE